MVSFYIYFYYRTYQLYKGSQRSDGPVSFLIGLNISLVLNVLARLLQLVGIIHPAFPLTELLIVSNGIILLLAYIAVPITLKRKRKYTGRKIEEFKTEPSAKRIGNGRKIALYIAASILLFIASILL